MVAIGPRKFAERYWLGEKLSTHLIACLILLAVAVLLVFVWQRSASRPAQGDYEGQVVDRWVDYAETKYGSKPVFRFRIESEDGKQFPVTVDANTYESAKIGTRIKSTAGLVVVLDSEQPTPKNR